jgi:chloramphenicol-sensitive protein RarD
VNEAAEKRTGLGLGFGAYGLWGLFPLFFPLLEPAGWLEILAQRMIWSLVAVVALLAVTTGFRGARATLRDFRRGGRLMIAGVLITVNWGVYIWGVNAGHVVECSLGYFINPIFTILLGVLVLHERLRPAQWAAVGIGAIAVIVIAVDVGHPPWIALVLAASFGLYGFLKKQAGVGAADSLLIETTTIFIPAAVVLSVIAARGDLVFGHDSVGNSLLITSSGVVTVIPLLMFAGATRRLPLTVMGLLQFLTPVLQFMVGVGIRHESVPLAEYVGFCLVWLALIVLSVDSVRNQRRTAREERAARLESVPA